VLWDDHLLAAPSEARMFLVTFDVPTSEDGEDVEYPVLVRATNGKGVEFSTRVRLSCLLTRSPSPTHQSGRARSIRPFPLRILFRSPFLHVHSTKTRQKEGKAEGRGGREEEETVSGGCGG
jgi:hypothetical protein